MTYNFFQINLRRIRRYKAVFIGFFLFSICIFPFIGIAAVSKEWEQKVTQIRWVAYFPPTADPNQDIEATSEAIQEDLEVLREAGFTGLVTYGAIGIMGQEFPKRAEAEGFQGIIMGIWDPKNEDELSAAKAASNLPIVVGFCVGNEGLNKRYQLEELSETLQHLRATTGKPVTTTEELHDYADRDFRLLGDWLFPNVHPYFHNLLDPEKAVRWTQGAFKSLRKKSDKFILFKEVGLPTAGDAGGKLSEENQKTYYMKLAETEVKFVYFEAFDQPWKTHLPIEPHWGIFRSDRTPKALGLYLIQK